ncbi:hypothetical protein J4Q44_G00313530 [Coregonus suidteri]|uniref:Ig-like domain-containing protein n=1 Tax=Coregonus suidteri TaxID=861788 RepID=A0AAN8KUK6_9TELE
MVPMKAMTGTGLYSLACLLVITIYPSAVCDSLCSNTTQCFNGTDVKVTLNSISGFSVYEGDDLTIDCTHNLPVGLRNLLVFVWLKDNHCLEGENNSNLTLKRVVTKTNGIYVCTIQSPCGNFTSDSREIKVEDLTMLTIVICGVSAVVLILVLGIGMKIMLKKEFAKTKNRRQQNAQNLQSTTTTE